MRTSASDLNGENPGVVLANELGVDMDELHSHLQFCEDRGPGAMFTITAAQAQFLRACMEVACEY